ncbi:hypothetical protein M413DRAFT_27683 [Hebeloma cylindrosporum]|uniref:HNH nuclease domain-containing protein n=1 Tax=Hebeloma cylindrosporum TaxID=76867 RepID=A0A0C3CCG9_HEBCY|nr:hypothetical protein M413DRAFT_27683 [Hebeloma cylindrosporum h7]
MPTLETIPLPLPINGPPAGFAYDQRSISQKSTSDYFDQKVAERDTWNSEPRCLVCGGPRDILQLSYIIQGSEDRTWADLKKRNYIPEEAKSPQHEPRNAMVLCTEHKFAFQGHKSIIRFVPEQRKYVYINFNRSPADTNHHGKAIHLNANDHHAPFPAALLIHEQLVRGLCPFNEEPYDVPYIIPFQDWMIEDNCNFRFAEGGNCNPFFNAIGNRGPANFAPPAPPNSSVGLAPGMRSLPPLDQHNLQDILSATRASASWKACVVEGTSWNGTAEENAEQYRRLGLL